MQVGTVLREAELSQLQLRSAFRRLGYPSPPADDFELPAHHCLAIWAVMLIERLKFLAPEQRGLLCDELTPTLTAELAAEIASGRVQTPMVVIADSRYATWHTRAGWLDMSNGETVQQPRVPPLETLAYNLAVLYGRNRAICDEIQRRKVPAHEPASQP